MINFTMKGTNVWNQEVVWTGENKMSRHGVGISTHTGRMGVWDTNTLEYTLSGTPGTITVANMSDVASYTTRPIKSVKREEIDKVTLKDGRITYGWNFGKTTWVP